MEAHSPQPFFFGHPAIRRLTLCAPFLDTHEGGAAALRKMVRRITHRVAPAAVPVLGLRRRIRVLVCRSGDEMKRIVLLASALLWFLPSSAQPVTVPGSGTLFGLSQPATLEFDCTEISSERMTCTFELRQIWKGDHPPLDSIPKYPAPFNDELCARARWIVERMSQGSIRRVEPWATRTEEIAEGCNRDWGEWREKLRREYERRAKACKLTVEFYAQKFRHEPATAKRTERWVTEEPPAGECQTQHEAEFVIRNGSLSYAARYKILNKSGRAENLDCKDLREKEMIFVSARNDEAHKVDCDTITPDTSCWSPNFPCMFPPPPAVR